MRRDEVLGTRERDSLAAQLAAAERRIAALEAGASRRALRDPVVGVALTVPAFRAQLEMDIARARRARHSLCVALIDLDGFRRLNLRVGFSAGDRVLAATADLLAARSGGVVCRIAADEFAVRFEAAVPVARAALEGALVELEALEVDEVHGVSASVGIADSAAGRSPECLLVGASAALAQARADGGGRVAVLEPGSALEPGPGEVGADVAAALAAALEERDRYTSEHSESVVVLTARVAEALALPADEVERVRLAALLHDIGKIGVPDQILHKPGPLDAHEWEIMRQHSVIGERIVRAIPGLGQIARIVRHEHERVDGGGYPDGLAGDAIPIGARIILACDAYHAMVSDRPYRRAMSHAEAMAELNANAGTQFDANVVAALVGCLYGRRQSGLATV
jgi:diguanylate cyclase (GGDEF)-like protein/putative nucleotidyltransferase with HDIG domain